jgi:DNA-binding transcriptional LysR family regulator
MGRSWLVRDALADGRLVRLPGPDMVAPRAYHLVYPESRPLTPEAAAFASWLQRQMQDDAEVDAIESD